MILRHGAHVVLLDGGRLLVLRNLGDFRRPNLSVVGHKAHRNPTNREILHDGPGIAGSRFGSGSDTFSRGDPHQRNEDRFAAEVAELVSALDDRESADVIVVAPPRSLAAFRRALDPAAQQRIVAMIDKDLTRHTVDELTRIIVGELDAMGA